MSGSSGSDSPSDDDDDAVVQRCFEETSTFGPHMKSRTMHLDSRCTSADAQTVPAGWSRFRAPLCSRFLLLLHALHPSSAILTKCLHDTARNNTCGVRQVLRRNTKGTRTSQRGAGRARSCSVLHHVGRPSPGPCSHGRNRVRHTSRRRGRGRALPGHSLCRCRLASALARSTGRSPPRRVGRRSSPRRLERAPGQVFPRRWRQQRCTCQRASRGGQKRLGGPLWWSNAMLDLLPAFHLASEECSRAGVQGGLAFKPPTFTLEPGRPTDRGLGPIYRDYSSQPSARNSGTTPSTSPSPFQDRGGREGGVVAATSRDTITQHI